MHVLILKVNYNFRGKKGIINLAVSALELFHAMHPYAKSHFHQMS